MILTTLCYIEKEDKYLMLHRTKKENDVNHDKWIGVGGKFEDGETPEECLLREVKEETGFTLLNYKYRGILTFQAKGWESEYIHLYTADQFEGTMIECEEGRLEWVDKNSLDSLPLWEGDRIFLDILQNSDRFFSLKLCYDGDKLMEHKLKMYHSIG